MYTYLARGQISSYGYYYIRLTQRLNTTIFTRVSYRFLVVENTIRSPLQKKKKKGNENVLFVCRQPYEINHLRFTLKL